MLLQVEYVPDFRMTINDFGMMINDLRYTKYNLCEKTAPVISTCKLQPELCNTYISTRNSFCLC
jgi:hypothetical protein